MRPKRGQTGAFRYPTEKIRGTEVPMKVFGLTHPIALSRPEIMLGSVLETFPTRMHVKQGQTRAFRYRNALFWGTKLPMNVFARTHPIAYIRPKMMFMCVLAHLTTRMHAK